MNMGNVGVMLFQNKTISDNLWAKIIAMHWSDLKPSNSDILVSKLRLNEVSR